VGEELARLRWAVDDLAARQRSDPRELALAARLRQETTLSVKQIAERLRLGKAKGARTNLHKFMNRSGAGGSQREFDFQ
jgi:predicted ABC-type ATPase